MNTFKIKKFEDKESWNRWIESGITPSDAAAIMGENPWEDQKSVLNKKLHGTKKEVTPTMSLAREFKPNAILEYQNILGGEPLSKVNIASIERPWQIAHIDGLRFNPIHLVEVRCGQSAYKEASENKRIPKPYWAEAQHIMSITNFKEMFMYFSHKTGAGVTLKVLRSLSFIEKMNQTEEEFLDILAVEERKLAAQREKESIKVLALATWDAVLKKAPKVEKDIYNQFVPTYITKRGKLTPLGESLLLA
jgi:putative phage-type endonuclease